MPLVTVYIPSHNYGDYVGLAIESVLRQTFNDWELIVIDDNSSDNTSEVLNLYKDHPQISIHKTRGIGLPKVCNFAVSQSKGEFIIRLDGDDFFEENILLILSNYLLEDPSIALVFPDYYLMDEYGKVFSREGRKRLFEINHVPDIPPHGACTMIRKTVIEEIGGYREDLGAQDGFDLWSRVKNIHAVKNVNLPLFYYRQHGKNLTQNKHRIFSARRQIKKDAVKESLKSVEPVLAIIPCRENYDFRKDLWSEKIGDKTLLERDINVCLASNFITTIIVTCDNLEAEKVVNKFDNPRVVFVPRDAKTTIRSSSLVPTVKAVLNIYDPAYNGLSVLRYIQTPFVSTNVLDEAITSLVINNADSSWGVEREKRKLFKRSSYGLEVLSNEDYSITDFDMIYRDSKTFAAIRNKNLLTGSLSGPTGVCFEVSEEECFFMNSERDLNFARLLISNES